jgi:hypothetical protein
MGAKEAARMSAETVTVAGNLLHYLRSGLKREIGAVLTNLQVEVEHTLEPQNWKRGVAQLTDACALFEFIGLTDDSEQADLALDLGRWPLLVLRSFECEHDREVGRLQDAAYEGFELPLRDVPALGTLVAEIRKKVEAPPPHKRHQLFLERQLAQRRFGRRRGDGR